MGYVVWASELIPTLTPPKTSYTIAMLPQWPHFYTGLLQAAGYLLLDSKKKKMIIISQQSDNPKDIIIDTTSYGPVFGKIRKTSSIKIREIVKNLHAKLGTIQDKHLTEQMTFQLPFLRVITDNKELIHISLGEKISQIQIKKLLIWIKKESKDSNIVLLTNIELSKSPTPKKTDEYKQILKYIKKPPTLSPVVLLFQQILDLHKKTPEIVAYVNPGDFGKPKSLSTRYVCAVG